MQMQSNHNTDAKTMQNVTNIKRNSSKNSEPLLSLLDLSEHKNWGVTLLISIIVQAVNLYTFHATSSKPRPLSCVETAEHLSLRTLACVQCDECFIL